MSTLPAHITGNPRLGTWVSVRNGKLRVHLGKVELGQGIVTALAQIAADALEVPMSAITVVEARTDVGPDQGLTAGSLSVIQARPALEHVGASIRQFAGPCTPLEDYIERIARLDPDTDLTGVAVAAEAPRRAVGADVPRLDLPRKILGKPSFLADLHPVAMVYGRVVRPPSPAATLIHLDEGWEAPGCRIWRDANFLAVTAAREADVDLAVERLRRHVIWAEAETLPNEGDLPAWLRRGPHEDIELLDEEPPEGAITATYTKPFLAHASIAPSVGMARWEGETLHIWTHSQGIYGLRDAVACSLGLQPNQVQVEHVQNAGCYGHNGADDAAFDAALLALRMPGQAVQVRWSREDELMWSPLSPAMVGTLSASMVKQRIVGWSFDVWGCGHMSRPGYLGVPGLLAGAHRGDAIDLPSATDPPLPSGGTTRNAVPIYNVGLRRITGHRKADSPLRTSAMRALGAYLNIFAIESFMDELAHEGGVDPVDFRLAHLSDARAKRVIEIAAEIGAWGQPLPPDRGRGFAFAQYKGTGAYVSVVAELQAESEVKVSKLTLVADVGEMINPNGVHNQLEGGAIQATSWTTRERVRFDRTRVTSTDWEQYPILRFSEIPEVVVHTIASSEPPVGAGEAAQGPTAAAIANAVQDALGVRVRDLPITAEAVIRAIEKI